MRRLLILRHAKSDWPAGVSDRERPLAQRGLEAAPAMGRYIAAEGLQPDFALVSPARRTRETWALVKCALGGEVAERFEPRIYNARTETLLALVNALPEEAKTVLLVGHNPGCEELAARLSGYGDRYAAIRMMQKYPSAGLAVIDFAEGGWDSVAPRQGRLDRFVTPASLGQRHDG
jgi:phosphohistidine phosphatase